VLVGGAEPHHPLDTAAVVPGPVEVHHLSGGGQVGHVALEVPLRALTVGRFLQRHHASTAGIQVLHEALDGAALAGRIAPLKENHVAGAVLLAPFLKFQQLDLEQPLVNLVVVTRHAFVIRVVLAPGIDRDALAIDQSRIVVIVVINGVAMVAVRQPIQIQLQHGCKLTNG
jgi:hypothetical protein